MTDPKSQAANRDRAVPEPVSFRPVADVRDRKGVETVLRAKTAEWTRDRV
jgi:hypothetical protein